MRRSKALPCGWTPNRTKGNDMTMTEPPTMQRALTPPDFTRHEYTINGVKTVLHSAGKGRPLVYWHGAGRWHGFDFARAWSERFRVLVPDHPGWGESGDDPRMDTMNDYLLHYLDLFDELGLVQFDLVGFSLGGWMAAEFAVAHGHRLRKLVLVGTAGLPDPANPGPTNMASWSIEEMYSYITNDRAVLAPYLPRTPQETAAHLAALGREAQSTGRLAAKGAFNPKLARWLHRVTMPTLVVWSKADRIAPVGRAEQWMKLLPNARLALFEKAGHLVLDELPAARAAVADFLH
jgi:pimeloyl-ACP methyl ester carboxylesterase